MQVLNISVPTTAPCLINVCPTSLLCCPVWKAISGWDGKKIAGKWHAPHHSPLVFRDISVGLLHVGGCSKNAARIKGALLSSPGGCSLCSLLKQRHLLMSACSDLRALLGLYPAGEIDEHFPTKLVSAKTDFHQHRKHTLGEGQNFRISLRK